ncbi:hypothetical protein HK102_000452 [Quaeritorhiza haematococci]|nr:hypothetical protein HK102_000452 [Quaeritorhiza haematococci]
MMNVNRERKDQIPVMQRGAPREDAIVSDDTVVPPANAANLGVNPSPLSRDEEVRERADMGAGRPLGNSNQMVSVKQPKRSAHLHKSDEKTTPMDAKPQRAAVNPSVNPSKATPPKVVQGGLWGEEDELVIVKQNTDKQNGGQTSQLVPETDKIAPRRLKKGPVRQSVVVPEVLAIVESPAIVHPDIDDVSVVPANPPIEKPLSRHGALAEHVENPKTYPAFAMDTLKVRGGNAVRLEVTNFDDGANEPAEDREEEAHGEAELTSTTPASKKDVPIVNAVAREEKLSEEERLTPQLNHRRHDKKNRKRTDHDTNTELLHVQEPVPQVDDSQQLDVRDTRINEAADVDKINAVEGVSRGEDRGRKVRGSENMILDPPSVITAPEILSEAGTNVDLLSSDEGVVKGALVDVQKPLRNGQSNIVKKQLDGSKRHWIRKPAHPKQKAMPLSLRIDVDADDSSKIATGVLPKNLDVEKAILDEIITSPISIGAIGDANEDEKPKKTVADPISNVDSIDSPVVKKQNSRTKIQQGTIKTGQLPGKTKKKGGNSDSNADLRGHEPEIPVKGSRRGRKSAKAKSQVSYVCLGVPCTEDEYETLMSDILSVKVNLLVSIHTPHQRFSRYYQGTNVTTLEYSPMGSIIESCRRQICPATFFRSAGGAGLDIRRKTCIQVGRAPTQTINIDTLRHHGRLVDIINMYGGVQDVATSDEVCIRAMQAPLSSSASFDKVRTAGLISIGSSTPDVMQERPLEPAMILVGDLICETLANNKRPSYILIGKQCSESTEEKIRIEGGSSVSLFRVSQQSPSVHIPVLVTLRSAYVSQYGHIYNSNFLISPDSNCAQSNQAKPRGGSAMRHSEVFVMSQTWGDSFFHGIIETVPRLMAYHSELVKMPKVAIHHSGGGYVPELLRFLGYTELERRLVTGDVYGGLVYYPEPSLFCGGAGSWQINALRDLINEKLVERARMLGTTKRPRTILVVQRTHRDRRIKNHDDLIRVLETKFPDEHIQILTDDPPPSLVDGFQLINDAKIIIAPHGSALTNLIAVSSTLKTVAIEFLPADNEINLCYATIAWQLGLEWYGVSPEGARFRSEMVVDVGLVVGLVASILSKS